MAESPMSGSRGVIHDIGYRSYTGSREGTSSQVLTLFVLGLRHAWGLGRSGRSKVLPFLLLAIVLLPALIMVGVVTLMGTPSLPTSYANYPGQMSWLVSLFAAAQAPVLFSRDLRFRSIVLYLARPLSATLFALTRWASLATAILLYVLLPCLVLYAGALLAGLDFGDHTADFLQALVLQVLLAMVLAGLTGLVSAWSLRRGFAVVISIVVLIVVGSIVSLMQLIARSERLDNVGEVAGLLSPWALYDGVAKAWNLSSSSPMSMEGVWPMVYLLAQFALVAGCAFLLVRRFTKVGAR